MADSAIKTGGGLYVGNRKSSRQQPVVSSMKKPSRHPRPRTPDRRRGVRGARGCKPRARFPKEYGTMPGTKERWSAYAPKCASQKFPAGNEPASCLGQNDGPDRAEQRLQEAGRRLRRCSLSWRCTNTVLARIHIAAPATALRSGKRQPQDPQQPNVLFYAVRQKVSKGTELGELLATASAKALVRLHSRAASIAKTGPFSSYVLPHIRALALAGLKSHRPATSA